MSWRVHILPYLGYGNLYDQFHLDEPWDSPHNVALLKYMPVALRRIDNHVVNPEVTVDVSVSVVAALSDADYHAVGPHVFSATIVDGEPEPPPLPGDFNRDGAVTALDFALWRDTLGAVDQKPPSGADANGDGAVTGIDYATWREGYGAALARAPVTESARERPLPWIG